MNEQETEQREKYPLPWIVGPFGCVWVAADVEIRDGKWRETCAKPRLVVDTGVKDRALAEFIVRAANATLLTPPCPLAPPPY